MCQTHHGGRRPQAQRGFTIVELMVALLIGLFLLGGMLTLVQDNRRAFASQNQLAQLQDAERLAMTMITDVIQSAGYYPDPTSNTAVSALPVAGTLAAGQALAGTYNAASPGDTITVRYATTTGDGILNCIGGTNTTGAVAPLMYTNIFRVFNGQLICNLNGTDYPLVGTAAANGISINKLQILYGVNNSGSGSSVDSYVNAAAVPNWSNVISIQVTLTFNNPLYVAANQGQPQFLTFQRVIGVMNQTGI